DTILEVRPERSIQNEITNKVSAIGAGREGRRATGLANDERPGLQVGLTSYTVSKRRDEGATSQLVEVAGTLDLAEGRRVGAGVNVADVKRGGKRDVAGAGDVTRAKKR